MLPTANSNASISVEALDCDDSSFNALDQSLTDTNFALQETIEDFDSLAEHTTDFRCKTIKTSLDENAQLLLSCSQCSKRFDNEKRLKIHLATHEKKIFSCEYCDKKFTKSVNVQVVYNSNLLVKYIFHNVYFRLMSNQFINSKRIFFVQIVEKILARKEH